MRYESLPDCIIIFHFQALSKQHACIEIRGEQHFLVDKGSRNKTRRGKVSMSISSPTIYQLQQIIVTRTLLNRTIRHCQAACFPIFCSYFPPSLFLVFSHFTPQMSELRANFATIVLAQNLKCCKVKQRHKLQTAAN